MPSVLFVCTANICRSPMAMGLFSHMLAEHQVGGEWQVESAGTWGLEGDPPAAGSQAVMRSMDIDISNHRARRVDNELLRSFDLILTMENGHKEALSMEFPAHAGRVFMLSEMAGEKSGKKHYLVDAGSKFMGRGVKTPLYVAKLIAKALRVTYRDFLFTPIEGRGAFGTEQSY